MIENMSRELQVESEMTNKQVKILNHRRSQGPYQMSNNRLNVKVGAMVPATPVLHHLD